MLVELLVDNKADLNCLDRYKTSPLGDALREGHDALTVLLKKRGGNLCFDDHKACSEMCDAARQGRTQKCRLLIEAGCLPDLADHGEPRDSASPKCMCMY